MRIRAEKPKATLASVQSIATIVSLVAVPIVVAMVGGAIQRAVQVSQSNSKLVELAIGILKEPPRQDAQPGLRAWAIEVLESSSSTPLSAAARRELQMRPLFPIQAAQRDIQTVGFTFVELDKQVDLVAGHKAKLVGFGEDFATLELDGQTKRIQVNESASLPGQKCVFHLLGFAHSRTEEEIKTGKDDLRAPTNSVVVASAC